MNHTVIISSNFSSKHHPDYSDTNATLSLINLFIRRRPIFSDLGTNADFEAAFNQWQNDVVDSIKDLDFERYPGVEKIAGILAGFLFDQAEHSCVFRLGKPIQFSAKFSFQILII